MEDYKKKYEDLITSLKKAKNDEMVRDDRFCVVIDNIVPQLKESEDERWIKWLIGHLKGYINQTNETYAEVCKDAIAWLEKQKFVESKDIDKAALEYADNLPSDGEVTHGNITEPYWNFHSIRKAFIDGFLKQKPAEWSEEDENNYKSLEKLLNEASCYSCTEGVDKILSWIKSIKPQPKQEWSEEDEKIRNWLVDELQRVGHPQRYYDAVKWLKSLKPQSTEP